MSNSYKGVRDFFPKEMSFQNYIFDIWKDVVKKYGYEEYNASVLEPSSLYKEKTSEEILNEQTYTFLDRGQREVTLRPEMTPTTARMISEKKRELIYPLRWYSIPNIFRYEQPQKGRLREHWQLNVDIIGIKGIEAEVEIISIAYDILIKYGLKEKDFEIRINNRKIVNYITKDLFILDENQVKKLVGLIDKRNKLEKEVFGTRLNEILGDNSQKMLTLLNSKNFEEFTINLNQTKEEHQGIKEIKNLISLLEKIGIKNCIFDQTIMRGFDYYTGIVFEVYDKNPLNKRSIFGGGRYDNLIGESAGDTLPAVGFGAGDVIAKDLILTYQKNIEFDKTNPADIYICILDQKVSDYAMDIAKIIRNKNINVFVDFSYKRLGDQIKNADKMKIPYVICIGEEEMKTGKFRLKNLNIKEEIETDAEKIKI